jgi:hypothetical protein
MNPPPRPARRWKITAVVLGSIAALALGIWVGFVVHIASRWGGMERRVRELIAEAGARDGRRPPIVGAAEPGNSWDDYAKAMEEMAAHPLTSLSLLKDFLKKAPAADRAAVEREVTARAAAFEHLSRGARKVSARAPLRWEGEAVLPHSGDGLLRRLAEFAVCRSRLLRGGGDLRAVVISLLETAQLGRDGAGNTCSEYEGEALRVLELVFLELNDLLRSRLLKDEELALLEAGLKTLDETLPKDGRALLNDVAFFGSFLLREDPYLEADDIYRKRRPLKPDWPHAFSMKLFKADAFDRWLEAGRLHVEAGPKGWDEAQGVFNRIVNLLDRPPENAAVNRLAPQSLETNRAREAQLKILRVAVRFLRTGEVESRLDPFGGLAELRSTVNERKLRVWSRGPNGRDDEGNESDRLRNEAGSTIIGPALDDADDLLLEVQR